ncbi:hypothetical protein [Azospirillum sp. TSA6c]|uniref:hypothetical protein n=1 Tax=Azospirillum sp. TSA6c TaxID=709813 RepID=UPI0011B6618B|nr:hypothetical protein [Azospirillum sp. TSA6c]
MRALAGNPPTFPASNYLCGSSLMRFPARIQLAIGLLPFVLPAHCMLAILSPAEPHIFPYVKFFFPKKKSRAS